MINNCDLIIKDGKVFEKNKFKKKHIVIKNGKIFKVTKNIKSFKSEKIMKDYGLRGASNGVDKKTGKKKYYSIKTSCSQREIIPLGANKIQETDAIKANKLTEDELLLNIKAGNDKIENTVKKLCT